MTNHQYDHHSDVTQEEAGSANELEAGVYPGSLFVVAAPSGAGKSSLVKALLELDTRIYPTVSHTTRAPRGQEKHGREYFFVPTEVFDTMVETEAFLEWANVHGNRYGTSKKAVADRIQQGSDVVLEIDFQGAMQVKKMFSNAILIFILPPSLEELRARLERRGEDNLDVIDLRMRNADIEMAQSNQFDYVIINDVFERAVFDLKSIVHAQRLRYTAQRRTRADTFAALGIESR